MLNKYFTYKDYKIELNRPELLLVKEFEKLMDDSFNKCKDDKTGKKKIKAFKIFKYLFLFHSNQSPYSEMDEQERRKYSLEDSDLSNTDLIDPIVIQAEKKYEILTKSRLSKMLEAAEIAVDNFTLYFRIADYTEIDDATGKARYNIKDGINGVAGLSKLSEGLKDLQDLVKKEQEAETDLRGGAEIGMLD